MNALRLSPAVLLVVALLSSVPVAGAEESAPSREEYTAAVEPICEGNTERNARTLAGVRGKVRQGKLAAAGGQFSRAAVAFGATIRKLAAVSKPPADEARLQRWLDGLGKLKESLAAVGVALKAGNRTRANHEVLHAERVGNAANNAVLVFGFRHCRIDSSKFL